jgi:hypothetical protein
MYSNFTSVSTEEQSTYTAYKEYHSVRPLVGIGTLPTPLSPASAPLSPEPKGERTLACGLGVGVGAVPIPRLEKKLITL